MKLFMLAKNYLLPVCSELIAMLVSNLPTKRSSQDLEGYESHVLDTGGLCFAFLLAKKNLPPEIANER